MCISWLLLTMLLSMHGSTMKSSWLSVLLYQWCTFKQISNC